MKKLISLFLCVLLLAGCAPVVYEGPTVTEWALMESRSIHYDPDTGEITTTTLDAYSYDSFGNQVLNCSYEGDKLMYEIRYTYDDRGNCIREVTRDRFWIFILPTSRTSHTYDEQDRLLSTTYRNGLGFKTGRDTYTYDDEANTVTWNGTHDHQTTYFNENGDVIRTETFSKPAGIQIETIEEYDELGRNIKTVEYMDGDLFSTTAYRYDDEGRLVEVTNYGSRGEILSGFTMLYDENIITTWYRDGYKQVETFIPDGLVKSEEFYNPAGKLITFRSYAYTEIQVPTEEE